MLKNSEWMRFMDLGGCFITVISAHNIAAALGWVHILTSGCFFILLLTKSKLLSYHS